MEKILKIEKNEVLNPEEILLIDKIECPIDSVIPLQPFMCSVCHTIFCKSCIDKWKEKSDICPMRCKNYKLIKVQNSIINQQIDLIKVKCKNEKNGCNSKILLKNKENHEKNCDYNLIQCFKCKENIPKYDIAIHFRSACLNNKISCYICNNKFNIGKIEEHLNECQKKNYKKCEICLNYHFFEEKCKFGIKNCEKCKIFDLVCEFDENNHKCINVNDQNELNEYFIDFSLRFEKLLEKKSKEMSNKIKDFNQIFEEKINEIKVIIDDKIMNIDNNISWEINDYENKKKLRQFEINLEIESIKNSIKQIKNGIEKKNIEKEEIYDLIDYYKIKFEENLLNKLSECQTKLQLQKNILFSFEYMKTLNNNNNNNFNINNIENNNNNLNDNLNNNININVNNNNNNEINSNINSMNIDENSNFPQEKKIYDEKTSEIQPLLNEENLFQTELNSNIKFNYLIGQCSNCLEKNDKNLKCSICEKLLCKKCLKICDFINFNNFHLQTDVICKECLLNCDLCDSKICKKCKQNCFNEKCDTKLCINCFNINKGQKIKKNSFDDCHFFKCVNCGRENLCVMKTMEKNEKRICDECFKKEKKNNNNNNQININENKNNQVENMILSSDNLLNQNEEK